MSNLIITKDVYQIFKKKKQESDQVDGTSLEDDNINELIINNETEKFFKLFEKVFTSEEEEEQLDSEDGLVQDIFSGIVTKIKEKLKNFNKSQVLNFIFKFFVKEADINNIDGKN